MHQLVNKTLVDCSFARIQNWLPPMWISVHHVLSSAGIQASPFQIRPRSLSSSLINPLSAELNHICHLLALLGAHPILHISRIRVNISSSQKATTYSVIMVFNKLLLYIKKLQHDKLQFKNALIHYLLVHTFYSYEDFLSY